MLLGDTLILDDLDCANKYRQEVSAFLHLGRVGWGGLGRLTTGWGTLGMPYVLMVSSFRLWTEFCEPVHRIIHTS